MPCDREEQLTAEPTNNSIPKRKPVWVRRAWGLLQWLVASAVLFFALMVILIAIEPLGAPDAPAGLHFTAVATLALVGILLTPPAFFRLPKAGKIAAFVGVPFAIVFVATAFAQIQKAYEATPEGAKAAAEEEAKTLRNEQLDRAQVEEDRLAAKQQAAEEAEAEAMRQTAAEMEEAEAKLSDCLTIFGEGVPDLKDRVKERLNNPRSFEHVDTTFFGATGINTFMQFRAENAFGGTVTSRVRARVDPDTCKVTELEEFSS